MSSPDEPSTLGVSLHSNTVTIDDSASKTIKDILYVADSLKISKGQPSKVPPKIAGKNNVWEITLQAGRQKTSAVAKAFNSICGGKSKQYAPEGGGSPPEELNFYFALTILFYDGGSPTVYVAQGSHFSTNNWWIGGRPIFKPDIPRLEYQVGTNIVTNVLTGDHKTFKLQWANIRPVSPIQNVFVLMLENHSFDNMLALSGIPEIRAATASDCNSYTEKNGTTHEYCFGPNAPDAMPTDPGHEFTDVLEQLAGVGARYPRWGKYPAINNSGFVANYASKRTEESSNIDDIMRGFDTKNEFSQLTKLAREFTVCDQWFSSLPGPTWPNRFFLHAASSSGLDHSPDEEQIIGYVLDGGFYFRNGSIFDRMKEKGITWRLFQDHSNPLGDVPLVGFIQRISPVYDVHSLTTFEEEVSAAAPDLYPYQYTFIEPNYGDWELGTYRGGTSQHPMDSVASGDQLIKWVYDTLRASPIWEQSLLIITYDEHGGFYDHYPPPAAPSPDDGETRSDNNENSFTFEQYGVRVPAVIVSPYVKKNHVDHKVYDHSSVLATLEYLFGLDPLTKRDKSAQSLHHLFSETPRKDTPPTLELSTPSLPPRSPLTAEEEAALELQSIPDRSTAMGMLGVLLKADAEISGLAHALARFKRVRTRGEARVYAREVKTKIETLRAARRND